MGLTFPRRPVVEFYLDQWRDVSLDVRQKPAITITHGRKDWATKLSPSTCRLTLDDGPDHGDGDYDPYNPLGQWFDYLSRNTPMRVALGVVEDTFARTVSSGWGSTPSGEVWDNNGSGGSVVASDWNVAAGVGTHSVPVASAFRRSVIPVGLRDVEVTATVTLPFTDTTSGDVEPANLLLRWLDSGNFYMARVVVTSAELLTISIHHSSAGQLVAPVTVDAFDTVTTKTITVKFQAEGQTLRAKAYAFGIEPLGWHVEIDDDRISMPGGVGIRNGVAAGNTNTKPIVFSVDNFLVRVPRFAGETVKMQPATTVDHADRTTSVEAAGIRRRLAKGEKPLQTALRRYIERGQAPFTVVDYWPFDQPGTSATRAANLLGGPPAKFIRGPVSGLGAFEYGFDTSFLSAPKAAQLSTDGRLAMGTTAGNFSTATGWMLTWLVKVGANCQALVTVDQDDTSQLQVKFDVGKVELLRNAVSLITITLPEDGTDTSWHMIGVGTQQQAGNIKYGLAVDETLAETTVAGTAARPNQLAVFADPAENSTVQVSQVVSGAQYLFSFPAGSFNYSVIRDIYLGRPGERAGTRFDRLCLEEGIADTLVGTAANTPAMGPQAPLPLMKLLDECVDVTQGSAFDPRGAAGLGLRTLRATVARDAVLTLDYASGHVAPDFGPITDDQPILNDVTAKRPNGGEYQVEQTSGPNNVDDPGTSPGAVGRADTSVTVNVAADAHLPDQAGWRVHMGTVDAPRYSSLTVDLAAVDIASDQALVSAVMDVGVDDHVDITGATVRRIFDDVRLIVRGYTETIGENGDQNLHKIVFNTEPYAPLDVAIYDDADARYDTMGSALTGSLTSSATSFSVSVTAGQPWTQVAARFPMDVWVGGERIRLSGIGAPSASVPPLTQTFTVAASGRAINGVVKAHTAGTAVRLFSPVYRGQQ